MLTFAIPNTSKIIRMKRTLAFSLFLLPIISFAKSLDDRINDAFEPIVKVLASILFWDPLGEHGLNLDMGENYPGLPIIVVWLVIGAVYFTFKMGFINLRGFKHSVDLARGVYDKPGAEGEVSHFQALVTALSATVGLGNIAGVAVAITLGGPGATFWMIIAGFFGMSTKFVECTLGVRFREIDPETGEASGGPMYYLRNGLKQLGHSGMGKVLAIMYAVLAIGGSFGGGNMFQANQAYEQVAGEWAMFDGKGVWFGIILAIFVGIVIIGGIKSIARVTDKVVPFMVGMYVLTAIIIIFMNFENVGEAFASIFSGAFSEKAIYGGMIGVLIQGFKRAAFSNEAGVGSAAIAHAAVKTDKPVSEGFVALIGPFIDTIVICTMTALVLIFTGYADPNSGLEGAQLTSAAFSSVIPWFKYILIVAIVLFAFSTMISWSYYGLKAWTFLFGNSSISKNVYKIIFLFFIVIGSSSELGVVIDFSDLMIFGMAFPNVLGLYFLAPIVKKEMKEYMIKLKTGEIKRYK